LAGTPNASRKRQIPLASRAPSIHGTFETATDVRYTAASPASLESPYGNRKLRHMRLPVINASEHAPVRYG
jgi:hypothetical protein